MQLLQDHKAITRLLTLAVTCTFHSTGVYAQPTQRPLLVNTAGAKPNLMISLDNSASMVLPFPDEYRVGKHKKEEDQYWAAQRSATLNSLYYDSKVTYATRTDVDGNPLIPNDDIVFISNQGSAPFEYYGYANTSSPQADSSYVFDHSSYEKRVAQPTGWFKVSQETETTIYSPIHVAYKASDINASTPAFTYALCTAVSTSTTDQKCTTWSFVNIKAGSTATISLPPNHRRTDCGPTSCTTAQEIQNILTWYRYYLYRMPATVTAIGQALNDPRLNNRIRLGYIPINYLKEAITLTPGIDVGQPKTLRGMRTWTKGSPENTQVYNWLYNQILMGSTPLHNTVEKVAQYLQVPNEAKENPWATDPATLSSTINPEMTCRRSYNLLFSDGGWRVSGTMGDRLEYDNKAGPAFQRISSGGQIEEFSYNPVGSTDRRMYTPFPGTATKGLADLTAQYFWHKDLRESLANQVATRPGHPAFWQNMTTYTVGYLIKPTGLLPAATSGLTFDQIEAYRTGFVTDGYANATKPSWPTGDLTNATDEKRIDDFIQAGFTGGGRGFSVQSAEEIKSVFDIVLSDILNATGSDAGIELSSTGQSTRSLAGLLKYGVDFRTVDNSGEVKAQLMDSMGIAVIRNVDINGNVLNPPSSAYWTASRQMPSHDKRRIFSMGSGSSPFEFKGNFSLLPAEVKAALKQGNDKDRIPDDSRFVDYLRGKEPVADAQNRLFRSRISPIGAIVNSPPLLVGASDNMRYDIDSTVSGMSSYAAFRKNITDSAASLYVPTNAGVVHVLSADKGQELAAFMPRRSMLKLLDQANSNAGFSYTLDGPLTANDIYSGTAWNQIAIGTGGRGSKLIYGIRSPLKANGDRSPDVSDYFWEVGPDTLDDSSLVTGYMTNSVRSGQSDEGQWIAVVNSGHYNGEASGAKAGLVVLDAMTGAVVRRISLPSTFSAGRGLSGVTLMRDTRKRIVAAYAGDANGNLWRFDLRGAPSSWKVSYGRPLFTTKNNRPIYGAPAWQAHPRGGFMIIFATGMLLDDNDLSDTAIQESIYGVWDPTSAQGLEQSAFESILPAALVEQGVIKIETKSGSNSFFTTTQNTVDWSKNKGWTFTLGHKHRGERSLDQIRNIGSTVLINTTVLDSSASNDVESCTAANLPFNYLYALNALDGAGMPAFDINRDGKFDTPSMVLIEAGGFSRGIGVVDLSGSGLMDARGIQTLNGEDEFTPFGTVSDLARIKPSTPDLIDPDYTCRGSKNDVTGQQNESTTIGRECNRTPKPWSRQQYQLTRPPF